MGYLIGAPKAVLNPDYNRELWSIQANQAEYLAKDMKNRSHGWILEAAGDIFREFTGVHQPDPSYIEEKLSRIEKNWAIKLDRESTIPESDIPLREELLRVYNSMDVKTPRAKAVVELINKIVDKDTVGIAKNIKYIREEIDKEVAKWTQIEIAPKAKSSKEPWEMTREELLSDPRFVIKTNISRATIINKEKVGLPPTFFDRPKVEQEHIIKHELAHLRVHKLVNSEELWKIIDSHLFGKYDKELKEFIPEKGFYQTEVREILAESIVNYEDNPIKYTELHPQQAPLIKSLVEGTFTGIPELAPKAGGKKYLI
ncbi:MAG TPA: hypothetical protein ENI13_00260 [candidate division CPR3 bacterium]|uniref:Uncharacterized protein n=1 Tax=candidate division CPR3 bacterium TaxID=2268181 RepID=A0A7C1SPL1_UNCC3|nr:hypothetical protein [candidate division CPR3 bacterium]